MITKQLNGKIGGLLVWIGIGCLFAAGCSTPVPVNQQYPARRDMPKSEAVSILRSYLSGRYPPASALSDADKFKGPRVFASIDENGFVLDKMDRVDDDKNIERDPGAPRPDYMTVTRFRIVRRPFPDQVKFADVKAIVVKHPESDHSLNLDPCACLLGDQDRMLDGGDSIFVGSNDKNPKRIEILSALLALCPNVK
jgi:hypothetical protein